MILAVQIFNSPSIKFRTEQFAVQAVISWTYLLHEYDERKNIAIQESNGQSCSLSAMINRDDASISKGIKNNISDIIDIRNEVSHGFSGTADQNYFGKFQACCLNFDKILCAEFGNRVSLKNELSLALQFSKPDFNQSVMLQNYGVPKNIQALDKRLSEKLTEDQQDDPEYQRRVLADDIYPYKPAEIAKKLLPGLVNRSQYINHTQAWKKHKARPESGSKDMSNTNPDWCIYHTAHKDYTYSQEWVDFITQEIDRNP